MGARRGHVVGLGALAPGLLVSGLGRVPNTGEWRSRHAGSEPVVLKDDGGGRWFRDERAVAEGTRGFEGDAGSVAWGIDLEVVGFPPPTANSGDAR